MKKVLMLAHRIPYPPNKGDKIRSFHLLRYLAKRGQVYLGAFIDDPADLARRKTIDSLCAGSFLPELSTRRARLRALTGMLSGDPLGLPYYRNRRMSQWVSGIIRDVRPDTVFVYSAVMGQFVPECLPDETRLLVDFVDVDSDKWRQYATVSNGLSRWVYSREGRTLSDYECGLAARSDASFFVSEPEAELFRQQCQVESATVDYYQNGVDADNFSPTIEYIDPFPDGARPVVFTGRMDYRPNIDAVEWFVDEVWPRIRKKLPDTSFWIIGGQPASSVRALGRTAGVHVTGEVKDIRPYLAHARLAVAPMRLGRGIQNKILEYMAMGRPVVATGAGLEGLGECAVEGVEQADSAQEFTNACVRLLTSEYSASPTAARQWVMEEFGWSKVLARLDPYLDGPGEMLEASA